MILEARGLSKAYDGVPAVRDVSFAVAAGERVAVIGPNGAGKTTCFNLLNGQLAPDAGDILLEGRSIRGLPPRRIFRRAVGRTFQVAQVFSSMTVRENLQVAIGSHLRGLWDFLGSLQHEKEADALLDRVGMRDQASRPAATLSYGDLKRLELALALANGPRLLLMDEPTAGMAPGERGELMRQVADLATREGVALLFTEHDMDVVFGHATRVMVLHEGRLIASGPPEAVRNDRKVREVYLGDA